LVILLVYQPLALASLHSRAGQPVVEAVVAVVGNRDRTCEEILSKVVVVAVVVSKASKASRASKAVVVDYLTA
jgi:hypothetical protein